MMSQPSAQEIAAAQYAKVQQFLRPQRLASAVCAMAREEHPWRTRAACLLRRLARRIDPAPEPNPVWFFQRLGFEVSDEDAIRAWKCERAKAIRAEDATLRKLAERPDAPVVVSDEQWQQSQNARMPERVRDYEAWKARRRAHGCD